MGDARGVSATGVLEAPEVAYAPAAETAWRGQQPAPAGALQRGYAAEFSEPGGYSTESDEGEYLPRRGSLGQRLFSLRGLLRSTGGRIVLGGGTLLLLGGAGVGLVAARQYVMHDPRFIVASSQEIEISGNRHLTRAQILGVFGGDIERNIFRVSLDERRRDLEHLPWVEHATVMRLLPNRIRVQITERVPVAYVRQGTQIGLADAHGSLMDMPVGDGNESGDAASYSFPVLTGISAADPASTRAARMAIYSQFLHDLDSTGKHYSRSLSEVDVSDPDDVKAIIASEGTTVLVHFGKEQFLVRYEEFERHLPEWKVQYPRLASADMGYGDQIVLEMQSGSAATTGADAAPAATTTPVAEKTKPAATLSAPVAPAKPSPTVATAATKTPAAKPLATMPVATKAAKPAAKPAAAHASGSSASNEKMFAALAAQRKAALAKATAAGGANP